MRRDRPLRFQSFHVIILCCWILSSCSTPNETEASSTEVISSEFSLLDSMLTKATELGEIPGAAICIVREGELIHHRSFGWSNPITEIPLQHDAIFRICSQTKSITSTAAMILWERGLIGLDDPVSKYLPDMDSVGVLDEFFEADTSFTTVPVNSVMTIRHLMTHQSGLSYGEIGSAEMKLIYEKYGVVDLFTTDSVTTQENCQRISKTALIHQPGEKWNYSLGLDVLVRVIEIASGEPFDVFLRREILDPLEMHHTHFYLPDSLEERLVPVFDRVDLGKWELHKHPLYSTDYPVNGEKAYFSGGAGLSSTPLDYSNFLQMYLNRGEFKGVRLLQESTIDTIMANHELNPREADWYQGLAFGVQKPESEGIFPGGTFFWGGYFNTSYAADPQSKTIGIIMKQTYGVNESTTQKFNESVFVNR